MFVADVWKPAHAVCSLQANRPLIGGVVIARIVQFIRDCAACAFATATFFLVLSFRRALGST